MLEAMCTPKEWLGALGIHRAVAAVKERQMGSWRAAVWLLPSFPRLSFAFHSLMLICFCKCNYHSTMGKNPKKLDKSELHFSLHTRGYHITPLQSSVCNFADYTSCVFLLTKPGSG